MSVKIPPKVQEKFPELVKMIQESQSMDNNERNYWFSMLLVMTEKQVDNLKDILVREKQRLENVKKTGEEAKKLAKDGKPDEADAKIKAQQAKLARERMEEIKKKEMKHRKKEKQMQEDVLAEIENL